MAKLVTIFGGSGFVGRYIARRMAKQGWRVRVASRHPNEALFVKTFGTVGQVEPVFCNIRDDASVAEVLDGADAAVNCVGILIEDKNNTFSAVQYSGAERIARLSKELGIKVSTFEELKEKSIRKDTQIKEVSNFLKVEENNTKNEIPNSFKVFQKSNLMNSTELLSSKVPISDFILSNFPKFKK